MKRPYQITGMVLVLFGVFMVRESLRLKFYTPLGPGPGFFVLFVSILIAFLGGLILFNATFRASEPMPEDFFPPRGGYLRIGAIIMAGFALPVLMIPIGFRLTMGGFLLFLLLAMSREKPLVGIPIALAATLGIHFLFVSFLKISLPTGMFGF